MKKNMKTPHFEVDFKQRLEQQRQAKNTVRLPKLGYSPYRVYEIEKENKQGMSKHTLNSVYGSVGTGKSSYNMTVQKSRQSGKTNWQQILWDYINNNLDVIVPRRYEVRWLKEKQATLLRLQGYTVEPTSPNDESTTGPVKVGA